MSVQTLLNLNIQASDNSNATNTAFIKNLLGLVFNGINFNDLNPQTIGVLAPTPPPTTGMVVGSGGSMASGNYYVRYTYVNAPQGESLSSPDSTLGAPAAPGLSITSGGSLTVQTYFVKVTYLNGSGETVGSAESTLAVAANNELVVASPAAATGATTYNVYISNTTGNETKQNGSPISIGTDYTQSTQITTTGAAVPSTNTATEFITVGASGTLTIPSPPASGSAQAYNVYLTASGGAVNTETKQNSTPIPIGVSYLQTAAVTSGAALPGSNTTLTWAPNLLVTPIQVAYLRNVSAGSQNLAISWTVVGTGATSLKVADLVPNAGVGGLVLLFEPVVGVNLGGITAFSIVASAAGAIVDGCLGS